MSFSYEYDYGSTTELKLKVASVRAEGTPEGRSTVVGQKRTSLDPLSVVRDKTGAEICVVCACDEVAWLCPACADRHSCEEEMRLPVTNSPRAGVCAYSGQEPVKDSIYPRGGPG